MTAFHIQMVTCPVCGYNPNPSEVKLTDAELQHQRILNTFSKNLMNTWWLRQPEYICSFLLSLGLRPDVIVDVGCGDGRWVPGIKKSWPKAYYVGIDPIKEHIDDNEERMPEMTWLNVAVKDYKSRSWPDDDTMFLLGGTLQERGKIVDVPSIINPIITLNPTWIVILQDQNTPWDSKAFNLPKFKLIKELIVPDNFQGPEQKNILSVYTNVNERNKC